MGVWVKWGESLLAVLLAREMHDPFFTLEAIIPLH
jgi:hypothetical protein